MSTEQMALDRRPPYPASDAAWWGWIAGLCIARREHVPHHWEIEYEDGADGCMPAGWYASGMDWRGLLVDWPIRQEFGPFGSRQEAEAHSRRVMEGLS